MQDLLNMAARSLRVGGRLVYLLPVEMGEDAPPNAGVLPVHGCLGLVCVCDQVLNSKLVRKMVVMEKVKEEEEEEEEGVGGREQKRPRDGEEDV